MDEVKIDVELRQKVTAFSSAILDPLTALAQQVFDAVKAAVYSQAVFTKAEKSPPAVAEKLREKFLWATGATFTFELIN